MCKDSESRRPSLSDARANCRRSKDPFAQKMMQVLRNTMIKIRTRSDCCGNEGQVGC